MTSGDLDGFAIDDGFEQELAAVITDAYPVLVERIRIANFAAWHRRNNLETDLAQETTMLFLRHCKMHKRLPDDALAYMVKIARNLANKQYEDTMRNTSLPLADQISADPDPAVDEEGHSSAELGPFIQAAIARLPSRQREATMVFLSNPAETHRELAARMGTSEDAYQKNLSRAFRSIRKAIEHVDGAAGGMSGTSLLTSEQSGESDAQKPKGDK